MWRRRCTPYQPRQQQLQQQQVQQAQQQQQHGCGCVSLRCWNSFSHIFWNVIFRLALLWYLYLHLHGQMCYSTQWIIFAGLWWLLLVRPAVWHCRIRSFDWNSPWQICAALHATHNRGTPAVPFSELDGIGSRSAQWLKNGCFVSNPVCMENRKSNQNSQEPCKSQNTKS